MHRITFLLVALVGLLVSGGTSELRAQGCTNNVCDLQFSASVSVAAFVNCAVTLPAFNFGTHFKSAGILGSNEANHVRARCTIDPPNGIVDISFPTLPNVLTRNGGTETVPILYGSESARAYDCDGSCGPVIAFNPSLGLSGFTLASGVLTLALGENGPNQEFSEVRVDISNAAAAGTYSGVITAQVALR